MGTAGQRCTTMRRLIVHSDVYDRLVPKLIAVYRTISIGDPRSPDTLVGPLIDEDAFTAMERALDAARAAGGQVHGGGRVDVNGQGSFYARPALRSEEHTSELQSLMRISYAVFCLKKKKENKTKRKSNDILTDT